MFDQPHDRAGRRILALGVLAIIAIAGCSADDPASIQETEPELTFQVDPDLTPPVASLPGFTAGESRPVGCIQNPDGFQAEFVSNELWISSNDQGAINALITRLSAEVLAEIATTDPDLSALPRQTLLRFDPATVDASDLVRMLEEISRDGAGEHRVSSADALGLFAAAAEITRDGIDTGINWIGRSTEIITRDSAEAPQGPGDYTPNAFEWPTHSVDSVQDIGVAEAWRGLELAGKSSNRVSIAILDQGFEINGDTPEDWEAISNVPFVDPLNEPNFIGCGTSACLWHGTNVLSAAMAVPDDGFGNGGPAGQFAKPVIVSTSYDFFTSISALLEARALGARIANMSYGAPVPVILAWSVYPFEATTALLDETGMLLFAAAGNDGENVDDESCFLGVCWENTWWTPCENAGVICVGGLRDDSKNKAGGSNYGAEAVDIFAPYTMYVGPDPDNPGNIVRTVNGTSFSSPFAAGVAAMIWAANPDLSSDQVRSILFNTAHSSPDELVNRYVNALDAVQGAIGNVPPAITIFGNTEITRQLNHEQNFSAMVSDFEDGNNCCDINWVSDVDGDLGTGNSISHVFTSEGTRQITVSATDSQGLPGQEIITLTIENTAPRAEITKPTPGENIFGSTPYTLKGTGFDTNEPGQAVDCGSLVWTSSNSADELPVVGCETDVTFASTGQRTLTLTATDPQGLSHSETVTINVVTPPDNLPPTVNVTSPQNGIIVGLFDELTLSGSAVDPEGHNPVSFIWSVNDGGGEIVVGNSETITWIPEDSFPFECDKTWDIRISLTATDAFGAVSFDFVNVRAISICKE